MNPNKLLIVLGNQLFPLEYVQETGCNMIFMKEDLGLCTDYKHHKLKILFYLVAMREYRDRLLSAGYCVIYHEIEDQAFKEPYLETLMKAVHENELEAIHYFEIEDNSFKTKFLKLENEPSLALIEQTSPMFFADDISFQHCSKGKSLRMASFYQATRKNLGILMTEDGKPIGGKWSFDEENRKRIPKGLTAPTIPKFATSKYEESIATKISLLFDQHPGLLTSLWLPTNREDAQVFLDDFLKLRFANFGHYEDAIKSDETFLFHSLLSPLLNIGLLTPREVIERAINVSNTCDIPINSLEGFVRQIIGWREFIRAVYRNHGEFQKQSNYFKHNRQLTRNWYNAETGIPPLDDAIQDCLTYGYTHHIPRLMIIANIMTLCRINPKEVFSWFMEMFIDSSEWVMCPNVFGMATFADGGLFATKPYICGSNYILKMSNYKKGPWCDVVDGLYWKFISDNLDFFSKNPRLSMITRSLQKMDEKRKQRIFSESEKFLSAMTKS